ncbi:MAG: response regulator [Nitriliruptorales bacterium]
MSRIRVGIVDDHTMVRQTLARLIESEGDFEVVAEAGSASEARARLPGAGPDLLLLDISLAEDDGIGLSAVLRRELPDSRVVFLTMHDDPATVQRALAAGAEGYLLKSASAREALDALRKVAAGGSYVSPELTTTVMALVRGRTSAPAGTLTDRELEVLQLLAAGERIADIAAHLFVSAKTVKNHLTSVYAKLGVETAAQAVAEAYRLKLVASTA